MILKTISGQETLPTGLAKFQVFVCPIGAERGMGERFIGAMAKLPNSGVRKVSLQQLSLGPTVNPKFNQWWMGDWEIPDRTLLKVFGWKQRGDQRDMQSVMIRMRESGPLQRLSMQTTGYENSQITSVYIEGRFDVISLEEAVQLGYRPNPAYVSQFSKSGLFHLQKIADETAPRVEVKTKVVTDSEGKTVEVASRKRKRTLDI